MQDFADYYSTMLARQLIKESREQTLAALSSGAEQGKTDSITIDDWHENLLDYCIFYNPGFGHQDGQETREYDNVFLRRWLAFYPPDLSQLPHHNNLQRLEQHQQVLNKAHAVLTAPLMAMLLICVILAALLVLRDPPVLLLIPVGLFLMIWLRIREDVKQSSQQLKHNRELYQQQTELLDRLTLQAETLSKAEKAVTLQENYTHVLEALLRNTISNYLPVLDDEQIKEQLHGGQMQVYVLESQGLLQIPEICSHSQEKLLSLGTLVRPGAETWCATQPYAELEGLTRIHYLFSLIILQRGVIFCHAYYDWVGNQMNGVVTDYVSWKNIRDVRLSGSRFPLENVLTEELTDTAYQTHFGQPVQVLSITLRNGEQHCCTLPLIQPLCQTLRPNIPGALLARHLQRDVTRLNAVLEVYLQETQA